LSASIRLLSRELATLGLDLQSTLREGPRFLQDARLLGALHLELSEQLGADDARAALLQLGFLHGLKDAAGLLRSGFGAETGFASGLPTAPALPLHLSPADPQAPLDLSGGWPERQEAEAVLAALGPAGAPSCHVSAGFTAGWLSGLFDADVLVLEVECAAAGADRCRFVAREAALFESELPARPLLEALPFRALREAVARHLDLHPLPSPEPSARFEPGAPLIHVWGPVMVIPFAGPEESLRALDLIGRDPGAREVRVVVVDLSGALIDDGFGAAALEQILDAVEGWGAEPILTGVSPLSAPVVAELERSHVVVQKDLPEAIAAAFQIADAQRRAS
jgi:hypothetical protein